MTTPVDLDHGRGAKGLTALVLGGGGARGAYQVGVVRAISRHYPELRLPILTGISSGAINAAYLAAHTGNLDSAATDMANLWLSLTPERVFEVGAGTLTRNVMRWAWRLISGGFSEAKEPTRGLVDTKPLFKLLGEVLPTVSGSIPGIDDNIASGRLRAVALSATSYATGQSVTWVQGNDVKLWQRPQRRGEFGRITATHVMASSALPLLFPAVQVDGEWYGDGGIRFTAPLSPALHLGAEKILTISTRYRRATPEPDQPQAADYPSPAQVLGVLYNAIFLDVVDQDILRLELINRVLAEVPAARRDGLRPIQMLVLRPSQDLGAMSEHYEPRLPKAFRFLTRGLGTRRTTNADVLSLVMFQRDYVQAVIDLGERDAESRMDEISEFLYAPAVAAQDQSADGYVSGNSPASQTEPRSSGSTARVES